MKGLGAGNGASDPSENRRDFLGWLSQGSAPAVFEVVAVRSPRSRRQPYGYSAEPRVSSSRRHVRRLACGLLSVNVTSGLRRCRQSPADVTEETEPKSRHRCEGLPLDDTPERGISDDGCEYSAIPRPVSSHP